MSRAVLVYLVLVIAPAATLSVFASRMADGDYRERVEALDTGLAAEAEALGRRIEGAMDDSVLKRDGRDVVGFSRDGRAISYSPDPPAAAGAEAVEAEELRFYRLSRRGGESYEHILHDPARALDAYAFYLPRIRSVALRARLRLAMARAALATGAATDHDLGRRLLEEIFRDGKGLRTEEGLPLDLLAAGRLLACEAADDSLRAAARDRLREAEPHLSTPLIDALAKAIAPGDDRLSEVLKRRRALESAVAASPGIFASRDAVLGPDFLLLGETLPAPDGGGSIRAIRLQPLALPALSAGDLAVRIEDPSAGSERPGRTSRAIRLSKGGPPVASLSVEDPRRDEKIDALGRRRTLSRALVGLLMLSTLAGGIALVRYVSKERQLSRLRAKLVANVSHELKSPVTSVRLFAEMLSDERLDASRARKFVDHLRAESLRLSQLVENLLDLSRLAKSEESLPVEPVDLVPLLEHLGEGFSFLAGNEEVEFATEGLLASPAAGPVVALTNAQAVERIVLNLLDNALKYRREARAEVRLRLERDARWARISVADNGPGIPRAHQPRVFEEFYRARYEDYGVKGSGLGLAIARRLARKLGGEVRLESREGVGSRFTLELPWGGQGDGRADPHR
jgi:signal transduction histidine kinase